MRTRLDITGQTFGRLTVVQEAQPVYYGAMRVAVWACVCACGSRIIVTLGSLRSGTTRSCGCLKSELTSKRLSKHGPKRDVATEKTYHIWRTMIARCTNQKSFDYQNYGGRGITVCKRWLKFENFLADMGVKPEGLSLDRKENDKGYRPSNCRWATKREQVYNRRSNRYLTFDGETLPVMQWVARTGLSYDQIMQRFHAKKSLL